MKSYYYFIKSPHNFGVRDVVFRVSVGSSERDQRYLTLVRTWANATGAYFKIRSRQSSNTVHRMAESLFPDSKCPSLLLHFESVSIAQLNQAINNWSWSQYENKKEVDRNQLHIFNIFMPSSMISNAAKGAKRVCKSVSRKYLSDEVSESPLFAAINFGLILLLFLFTAFIDKVFGF